MCRVHKKGGGVAILFNSVQCNLMSYGKNMGRIPHVELHYYYQLVTGKSHGGKLAVDQMWWPSVER